HRLSELGGAAAPAGDGAPGGESSLVRAQPAGALPQVERMAKHALKGSSFERWLEQSGMALSLSGCLLISLALGAAGAFAGLMFSHRAWVMPIGFAGGLCLLPAMVRRRR